MEFDPRPASAPLAPPPSETANANAGDAHGRIFLVLTALCAVATAAGYPYAKALGEQGIGAKSLARLPAAAAISLLVFSQMVVLLPALVIGLRLGPRLGLGTPLLRAWLERTCASPPARSTLRLAALVGLALGALITLSNLLPFLDFEEKLARAGVPIPESPPWWAGVLGACSAGVTEEVLLRFGLFTLVAWIVARLARSATTSSAPPIAFYVANVVAALVFGTLHFFNADAIGLPLDAMTVAYILGINGVVGLACGWLYWRRGLEAAIVAHVAVDLVIHGLVPGLSPRP